MVGKVQLLEKSSVIPSGGITTPKVRVELQEVDGNKSWIAELIITGDLPWLKGDSRNVNVRVMSNDFRDYVFKVKPDLRVLRGSDLIGKLVFV